jgi:hypothetical protein
MSEIKNLLNEEHVLHGNCPPCHGTGSYVYSKDRCYTGADSRRASFTEQVTERCSICGGTGWLTQERLNFYQIEKKRAAKQLHWWLFWSRVKETVQAVLAFVGLIAIIASLIEFPLATTGILLGVAVWNLVTLCKHRLTGIRVFFIYVVGAAVFIWLCIAVPRIALKIAALR